MQLAWSLLHGSREPSRIGPAGCPRWPLPPVRPSHAGRPGGLRGAARSCRAHAILQEACEVSKPGGRGFSRGRGLRSPRESRNLRFSMPRILSPVCQDWHSSLHSQLLCPRGLGLALAAHRSPSVLRSHSCSWLPLAVSAFPSLSSHAPVGSGSHPACRSGSSSTRSRHLSYCVSHSGLPPRPGLSGLQLPSCWLLVASWPGRVQPESSSCCLGLALAPRLGLTLWEAAREMGFLFRTGAEVTAGVAAHTLEAPRGRQRCSSHFQLSLSYSVPCLNVDTHFAVIFVVFVITEHI